MSSSIFKIFFAGFLCIILIGPAGCTTAQQKEETQKRIEEVKTKIKNYDNLEAEIKERRLKQGDLASDIRKAFGNPDDIFKSGSNTGAFEIWTYEKVTEDMDDEGWENIRLYFDNGKLVSWNF